mmetsp:Transcript_16651/g.29497  ORF Transcript_16651/g.29497 Transcript_16651/m.29497 type:complete len:225 (+) Transcript_16651:288-962(+)|eukprot:CAMPEP_0184522098 /NCGR_PEP_ID=MMETSP0198_2-20121128/8095_1 /TAXON_ID=1112570 /ORGANISM="Thraustochytrium sp., Strain LLF1b" /LENGTH=224 /DNA_ID=CAMNT_0026912891 /DNA_START=291 /DNA_END=965 /DNA_ORIENTATION=+
MGNDKSKHASAPAAKKPVVSKTVDQAAQMKGTVNRLEQRREFIEKKAQQELLQAKVKSKRNDKKGALAHLKRKKMYEKEIDKINNGILNLEQQVLSIESTSVTVDIVNAMKTGKNAMQSVTGGINADDVADLQDEIADLQAQQNEIDETISQPMGFDLADEEELENELLELETEGLEAELDTLPAAPTPARPTPEIRLPAAPTHTPVMDDDDAALAELEREMLA